MGTTDVTVEGAEQSQASQTAEYIAGDPACCARCVAVEVEYFDLPGRQQAVLGNGFDDGDIAGAESIADGIDVGR